MPYYRIGREFDMYRLEQDVYFVAGAKCATLYDSRCGSLYHLDRDAAQTLSGLLLRNAPDGEECNDLVRYLTDKKLLVAGSSSWTGDIHNLAEEPQISFAWIEVTTACNLKCIHCYEGDTLRSAAEMSMETFVKIVDELRENNVRRIQLIGGEPLAAGHLRDFIRYASEGFDFVEVYTNGTLVDEDWVKFFKKHNIKLALSVYSYEQESHDKVTGVSGSWLKTNSAIRIISDSGVKYRVRNVLIKGVPLGCKGSCLYTLNPNKDVVRMVGRANANLLSEENVKKRLITKRSFSAPIPKARVARMVGGHNCFATHLYFDVHGEVYPCVMERRISHGNILSAPLAKLLRADVLRFNKDRIEECKECEFRYFCFDCRPDSMGKTITTKPWYCTYQPQTGQWTDQDSFISNLRRQYNF